jgi:XTP/dITP diphosphohydrolase
MADLLYSTGNAEKFDNAKLACDNLAISIEQCSLDIDEIQSEDGEAILVDKLQKTFKKLKKPVLASDDTWEIPALQGFPGPYMKSINHWFSPEDYLRLTLPLEDRSIYLIQRLGFTNGKELKLFTSKTKGTILKEVRGLYGAANHKLVTLDGDNGLSIAEIYDRGLNSADRHAIGVWDEFLDWYVLRSKK